MNLNYYEDDFNNSESTVNESVIREYRTEHLAKLYSIGSEEYNLN